MSTADRDQVWEFLREQTADDPTYELYLDHFVKLFNGWSASNGFIHLMRDEIVPHVWDAGYQLKVTRDGQAVIVGLSTPSRIARRRR
ncbi:hypothetical protein KBZ00_27060 [Streptomyces sp. RK31]|uniref:hypothetical protein n=1 Tax=Streptomyces sp. RK31 TaxID=2824892 RepID=UPI001B395BD8|nr:hypothetical protein [Streptomyces sp. RK31]MBQ0974760.1 hypothetical protein [Streptomyces sp. RK31]